MHWDLPLIRTAKGGFFPLETCLVERLNPYPFKLDSQQVRSPTGQSEVDRDRIVNKE